MSLMSKLSATLLLSISLFGATDADVVKFLEKGIGKNPNIISLNIKVINKIPLKEPAGWEAYMVKLNGKVKAKDKERSISQSMTYFVKGDFITPELHNLKTGERLNETVAPTFEPEFYRSENLIYGNADAKHKVVIFSDPLCPFCRSYVPEAINYIKKRPKDFALYYYHFPLPTLHPAAVALSKAAIAAEQQGRKNVVLDLYTVEVKANEPNEQKILDAFNKTLKTNITIADIHTDKVEKQFEKDQDVASNMMVNGTPMVFFDGKKDMSKNKFRKVK